MTRVLTYILILLTSFLFAQKKETKQLYKANEAFAQKNYILSEKEYRTTATATSKEKTKAAYNLGNSIYRQNQPSEAKYKFYDATKTATTKEEKHKAYHNLGNALMLEKDYEKAAEAYKNALRNNPTDEETRYNYALAKQKAKENEGKNKDKNKEDKKEKEDKKDKNKKDGNQDKKEDKKEGDDKKEEQPKPSKADQQKIENMLKAVENAEKKTQEKINAKKVKGTPTQTDKDW